MIKTTSFSNIVDIIYGLPFEERIEIKNLLEHNIANARRHEILQNYKEAKRDYVLGKLQFSSDTKSLKKMLK